MMKTFGTKLPGKSYVKRLGAYFILLEKGKIAVIQFEQGYFLPGGGVDEGEALDVALKREAREELGWDIDEISTICIARQYFYTAFKDLHIENIGHFFTAKKVKKLASKVEEGHVLAWLTPAEAAKQLYHEHQRWAVEQSCTQK